MEYRYRLIAVRYHETLSTESVVFGEFIERVEMENEIEKRRWKGDFLMIDFLIDGVWCRGNVNSPDPIVWSA